MISFIFNFCNQECPTNCNSTPRPPQVKPKEEPGRVSVQLATVTSNSRAETDAFLRRSPRLGGRLLELRDYSVATGVDNGPEVVRTGPHRDHHKVPQLDQGGGLVGDRGADWGRSRPSSLPVFAHAGGFKVSA
jgi:hypothetical protein